MWQGRRGSLGLIAYIGCACTFVSIALDPFAQQLLSFPLEVVELHYLNSSVARSQIYDYGYQGTIEAGALVIPCTFSAPQQASFEVNVVI